MMSVSAVLVLFLGGGCSALQLTPSLGRQIGRVSSSPRSLSLHSIRLQEPAEKPPVAETISDEALLKAAQTASEAGAHLPLYPAALHANLRYRPKPSASSAPGAGGSVEEEKEPFDPRLIVYVSLPALVLLGQLFFTFSRDALGDAALGPAVMDAMP